MNENESSDTVAWDSIKGASGTGDIPLGKELDGDKEDEMPGKMADDEASNLLVNQN